MTTYIALLRGVNVAGKRRVSMAELQAALVEMGFSGARTLLNSGNVVFRSKRKTTPAELETLLETEVARRLGLQTDFHVRTAEQWQTLIARNPLSELAARKPGHLVVMCLKAEPTAEAIEALRAANRGEEVIHADGRHLYVDYSSVGIGESKLTAALMDGKLRTRGTGRNWNTVLKLATLAGG